MASILQQDWENYNRNNPTALRPPSYWDAVKENLPHQLTGLSRVGTNALGFPVDIVNLGLEATDATYNLATGKTGRHLSSDYPFMGSRNFEDAFYIPERTGNPTDFWSEIGGEFLLPTGQGLARSALKAEELFGSTLKEKLPDVVGKYVPEPFKTPISGLNMIDAYHGSPYKFSKFSTESIGTGEGAQGYGHGLYFAESPKVAGIYAKSVKDRPAIKKINLELSKTAKEMEKYSTGRSSQSEKYFGEYSDPRGYELKKKYNQLLTDRKKIVESEGNIYNVKLDVDKKELLDWDVELGKQGDIFNKIPKKDRSVVEDFIEDEMSDLGWNPDLSAFTGGEFKQLLDRAWDYQYFPDDHFLGAADEFLTKGEAISVYLKSKGIKGITYKDAFSRFSKTEEPTNNIVIFDDSLISIVDDAVK